MSKIEIQAVRDKKELKSFIYLPKKLYRGELYSGYAGGSKDPYWVPPIWADEFDLFNPKKHPIYKHARIQAFLARKDGKIVGRIAAIKDDSYIQTRERQAGFFGFFESIPDAEVAHALQNTAIGWCKEQGLKEIIGPISPSPNHIIGMLSKNFTEPPVVQTPYNPEYYLDFFREGWEKEMKLYAYRIDRGVQKPSEKAFRVAKLAQEHNKDLHIRPINMRDFWTDVEYIRQIWNNGWADHREFIPWPEEEFRFMAKNLKMITNPKLAEIAFVKDVPAGFVIPLPNVNEALIKSSGHLTPSLIFKLMRVRKGGEWLRLAILGVRKEYQKRGIEAIMLCNSYENGLKLNYQHADMSFITEDNLDLLKLLDHMNFERYREYKTFCKTL